MTVVIPILNETLKFSKESLVTKNLKERIVILFSKVEHESEGLTEVHFNEFIYLKVNTVNTNFSFGKIGALMLDFSNLGPMRDSKYSNCAWFSFINLSQSSVHSSSTVLKMV